MMSLTFGLFTQVSGLGPLGPLVIIKVYMYLYFSANVQEIPFYSLFCLSISSERCLKMSIILIVQFNQVTYFISRSLHAIDLSCKLY